MKKIIKFDVELLSTSPQRQFTREKIYTNDLNSVQIDFNITDMAVEDLTGATAQVMLFMMDGSFFQNPSTDVTLAGTTFSYLLKENEGNHAGIAKIQLVVTLTDESEIPSPKLEFEIVRGLEMEVASEVMIHDWTTLTREARAYLDEAIPNEQTRVDSELARVEAEIIRAQNAKDFAKAEALRVQAEGLRVEAESLRVTAENLREQAEVARQTTFNQNQVDRQTAYMDAENARDIAYGARVSALEEAKIKKYGVKFTGSNPVGERLYDAIGMKSNVAVNDEIVENDFDEVTFFNRPMCNVYFDAVGNPQVMAYRGEPGFDFEGAIFPPHTTKADVYYECKPCSWNGSYDEPVVTGTPIEGFELFPCFPDWNTPIYLPTFWMAKVDGVPTSRSGVRPGYYSLNSAMTETKPWNENAHTETMATHMYEYVLQLVEFATRDVQTVMVGCSNLRYNSATDLSIIAETAVNRIIVSNSTASNYVVGQTIVVGTTQNSDNVARERSITSIETYDLNNKAMYFDGDPVNVSIGNFVSSRVWKNGATDIIRASSGSPISNTNGKYPCIWRGKVDPWAQGFSVICDILIKRNGAGTTEGPYTYRPFFLSNHKNYANGTITSDYTELQFDLPQTDGYAKLLGQDSRYKHIGLTKEVGAASTTWLSAYYYYPRYEVCAVFVGGNFNFGRACSPVYFLCDGHPSYSHIYRLARLFVTRA